MSLRVPVADLICNKGRHGHAEICSKHDLKRGFGYGPVVDLVGLASGSQQIRPR